MATKKQIRGRHKTIDTTSDYMNAQEYSPTHLDPQLASPKPRRGRTYMLLLLVALLAIVVVTNKGMLFAAFVNGKPIFRWDLTRAMTSRFGKQTLEGIINQQLIEEAARASGVSVNQNDIDEREGEIVKNVGGSTSIADILRIQGMSKEEFDGQIRLQLAIEKILGKDISITDNDVDQFIATNRATLTATTQAELRGEAKKALFDEHIGKAVETWFKDLKDKANVVRFL